MEVAKVTFFGSGLPDRTKLPSDLIKHPEVLPAIAEPDTVPETDSAPDETPGRQENTQISFIRESSKPTGSIVVVYTAAAEAASIKIAEPTEEPSIVSGSVEHSDTKEDLQSTTTVGISLMASIVKAGSSVVDAYNTVERRLDQAAESVHEVVARTLTKPTGGNSMSGSEIMSPDEKMSTELAVPMVSQKVQLPPQEGMYRKLGDEVITHNTVLPPAYRPLKRRRVEELRAEVYTEIELATEYYMYKDETPITHDELRHRVPDLAGQLVSEVLPAAIGRSPAAGHIIGEVKGRALAYFEESTDDVEEIVADKKLQPHMAVHERNKLMEKLVNSSAEYGQYKVIVDLSKEETVEQTARALSRSVDPEDAIQVHRFSKNGKFFVDALRTAELVGEESRPGGKVTGRSDTMLELVRPNGVSDPTFRDTVGMIQHPDDTDLTLVYELRPGYVRMPGLLPEEVDKDDCGLLEIDAIAVNARRFDMQMAASLNAPSTQEVEIIGEGGFQRSTETRDRVDLVQAVRRLSDPHFLGQAKERDYRRYALPTSHDLNSRTASGYDPRVIDAAHADES